MKKQDNLKVCFEITLVASLLFYILSNFVMKFIHASKELHGSVLCLMGLQLLTYFSLVFLILLTMEKLNKKEVMQNEKNKTKNKTQENRHIPKRTED